MVGIYNDRKVFTLNNQQNCPYCNPAPSEDQDIFSGFFNSIGQDTEIPGFQNEAPNLLELIKSFLGIDQDQDSNLLSSMYGSQAPELNNLADKAYPFGNLNNYRLNNQDINSLRENGHNNYREGQPLNNDLNRILRDDYGKYTSSKQMSPDQIDNITQGNINSNVDSKQLGLSQEQGNNAKIIASVVAEECRKQGRSPEETKKAVTVALATAMQESELKNLPYGDANDRRTNAGARGSLGLFQQRGNGAWGSAQDRLNPATATQSFVKELLKTDYMNKSVNKAAQDVQRSGSPNGYAKHEGKATALANAMLAEG